LQLSHSYNVATSSISKDISPTSISCAEKGIKAVTWDKFLSFVLGDHSTLLLSIAVFYLFNKHKCHVKPFNYIDTKLGYKSFYKTRKHGSLLDLCVVHTGMDWNRVKGEMGKKYKLQAMQAFKLVP